MERISPQSPDSRDTGYQAHAVLYRGNAYIAEGNQLDVVDLAGATTLATIRPKTRPLQHTAAIDPDATPVLTGDARSPLVIWPFLVTTGSATSVELASVHTDTHQADQADQVMVPLPAGVASAEPALTVTPVGTLNSTVVLDLDDQLSHTVLAVDSATGRTLWSRPNFAAVSVSDTTVVGTESDAGSGATAVTAAAPSQVTGVDITTGKTAWTRPGSDRVQLVSAGPTLVAATRQADTTGTGHPALTDLLSARTGAVVATLPVSLGDRIRCLYDQASVTACTGPIDPRAGGRVVATFDARSGHTLWTLPNGGIGSGEVPMITAAWHGYLFATPTESPLTPATTPVVTNGQPTTVPLAGMTPTVTYLARTGAPAGSVTGPVPVLVDDQGCLAVDGQHTHLVARPTATHTGA